MVLRKRKLLVIAGVLTVIGLLLASCGPAAEGPTTGGPTTGGPTTGGPTTGGPTTTTPPVAKEGAGILRVAHNQYSFRQAMDPVNTSSHNAGSVGDMIWDQLVKRAINSDYIPAIAKSWKIGEGAMSIDFTLDEKARFHNGDPVTAKDVKFSIDKYRDPKALNSYTPELRDNVSETIVVDDYHFTIRFNKAYPGFLDRCADRIAIMPMDYYNSVGLVGYAANPVGSGPFKVTSHAQDQFINMEAVTDHYRQPPYIKGIKWFIVSEATTRFAMLKTGEVDMIVPCEPVLVPDLRRDPNLREVTSTYFSGVSMVWLDLAYPEPSPWKDIRLRQAASLAIDRETMCEKVFNGVYTPMASFLAPYCYGYDPTVKYEPDPYDPVKAKQLLADAGYPNGIDVVYPCSNENKYFVEPMVAYFNDVGIRAKIVMYEAATLNRLSYVPSLHGIMTRGSPFWIGIKHAGFAMYSMMGGGSFSSYGVVDPKVRAAIEASFSITDEKALTEAGKKIADLEMEGFYSRPLWVNNVTFGIGPRIAEYNPPLGKGSAYRIDLLKLTD